MHAILLISLQGSKAMTESPSDQSLSEQKSTTQRELGWLEIFSNIRLESPQTNRKLKSVAHSFIKMHKAEWVKMRWCMPDLMNEFGLRMHRLLPMSSFCCLSQFLVSFYRCRLVFPPIFPFTVCNLPFVFLLVIRKQVIEFPSITYYTSYLSRCTDQNTWQEAAEGRKGLFCLEVWGNTDHHGGDHHGCGSLTELVTSRPQSGNRKRKGSRSESSHLKGRPKNSLSPTRFHFLKVSQPLKTAVSWGPGTQT